MNGYQIVNGVNGYGGAQLAGPLQAGQPNATMGGQPGQANPYGYGQGPMPMVGGGGGYQPGMAPQQTAGQGTMNPNVLQYGPQAMQNYTQNSTYAGPAAGWINNFNVGGANGPVNSLNNTMGGYNMQQINSINQAMGGQQFGQRGIGTGLGAGAFSTYGMIPGQGNQLGSYYDVGGQNIGQNQLQGVLSGYGTQLAGLNGYSASNPMYQTPGNLGQLYQDQQGINSSLTNANNGGAQAYPIFNNPGGSNFNPTQQSYFGSFNNDPSNQIYQPGYNAQTTPYLNASPNIAMGGAGAGMNAGRY